MRRYLPHRSGVLLALLAALAAPPVAAGGACSGCVQRGAPIESCADCPPEVRAVLAGSALVVRRSPQLPDDCVSFEPLHPMLSEAGRARWSKPLDLEELANAERYGVRRVVASPACQAAAGSLPARVVFARPLSPEDRLRDDGAPKPVVYVDSRPGCLENGRSDQIRSPATPACTLSAAVRATRADGGTIIEIARGTYQEPGPIQLGHGQVIVARNDEPVTLSGWIDVSAGTGRGRRWVEASRDERGTVFVVDWSDHGDTGGSDANLLPLEIDGRAVPVALHYDPSSRASDVDEIVFTTHDARAHGPTFVYANPDHPATCMDSGVNVKSVELICERDGRDLPCEECRRRGVPVLSRTAAGKSCQAPPGACVPKASWRTAKARALELCRRALGPHVGRCVALKLPPGAAPHGHRIRSSHTNHGLHLYNDQDTFESGVVIRGVRLENVPIQAYGARRITARSGLTARLDGLELVQSPVSFLGPHLVLENSYGELGRVVVVGTSAPLSEVSIRNNVLDRYYGKPIHWADPRGGAIAASPRRLHALAPLCETPPCAGGDAPVLFTGQEAFAGWAGWNKILFNLVRNGAGIDAGPTFHLLVVGNAFEHGGLQEVVELARSSEHVLVHHNWARDGLGSGILVHGRVSDLVVTDNQLLRQPGDIRAGAGTDRGEAECPMPLRPCLGSPFAIQLDPGGATCREATFENNLVSGSRYGGFSLHACSQLTIRNHTAHGGRHPFLFAAGPVSDGARVLDNVVVAGGPARPAVGYSDRGSAPFRIRRSAGNYFEGCDAGGRGCPLVGQAVLVATDPGWSGPPRFADPEADDFHLLGGWSGALRGPGERYVHPGFNYCDERPGSAPHAD